LIDFSANFFSFFLSFPLPLSRRRHFVFFLTQKVSASHAKRIVDEKKNRKPYTHTQTPWRNTQKQGRICLVG